MTHWTKRTPISGAFGTTKSWSFAKKGCKSISSRNTWTKEKRNKKHQRFIYIYGCFLKWWYPQIIHFNRDFHYKPSSLGCPYFLETPIYISGGFVSSRFISSFGFVMFSGSYRSSRITPVVFISGIYIVFRYPINSSVAPYKLTLNPAKKINNATASSHKTPSLVPITIWFFGCHP